MQSGFRSKMSKDATLFVVFQVNVWNRLHFASAPYRTRLRRQFFSIFECEPCMLYVHEVDTGTFKFWALCVPDFGPTNRQRFYFRQYLVGVH